MKNKRIYRGFLKPAIDRSAALVLLAILTPLYLLIVMLIFLTDGRPVHFVQKRVGKDEKIFGILKFRTMRKKEGGNAVITPLGMILRRASLDEIPQLWNVLKGEMSLVGPRPLLVEYLPHYNERQRLRHQVKPGITGLAQVNGRNTLDWVQKLEYDIVYVHGFGIKADFGILTKTVLQLFRLREADFHAQPFPELNVPHS